MKTFIAVVAGGTLIAALIWAGLALRSARDSNRATAVFGGEKTLLEKRIAARETESRAAAEQAAAIEKDNTTLRSAIDSALASRAALEATAPAPVTRAMVDARYARGKELARTGDVQGALKEFLWCYTEGMARISEMAGVRQSNLVNQILGLGPDGEAAIRALREEARAAILAGGSDRILDFGALSRALKDNGATVDLYDSLPEGDGRRKTLAITCFEQFLAARRYTDAISGTSFNAMVAGLEIEMNHAAGARIREFGITSAAKHIEALAGAGQMDSARTLIARLLSYDSSDATKARIQEHLTRAGHPELLSGEGTGR